MTIFKKKVSPRRRQVREIRAAERKGRVSEFMDSGLPRSIALALGFALVAAFMLSINVDKSDIYLSDGSIVAAYWIISLLMTSAMGLYIYFYEPRIIEKFSRTLALGLLFILLLFFTRLGAINEEWMYLSTGTAVTSAMILSLTYNQHTSLVLSMLYAALACFAVSKTNSVELFLTMLTGIFACCFNMREIRTRMKLIQISSIAAAVVFSAAFASAMLEGVRLVVVFQRAGSAGLVTLAVGLIIQGFLPIIEKLFGVVTSMTLIDYSDANQPLLRKLAIEAPGTFSHSLLVGTIAEKAAEAIGVNGLLCRVGAYYHDIGKVNKPDYFYENQMGGQNRHDQLSPTMSKHVIVGHVKDGIEIAKEYGLPVALRQFIETHHGRTLIKCFYEQAKQQSLIKGINVHEQDYRYPGPFPQTKEAAIVMLADCVESAVRAMPEPSASRIQTLIHNLAMSRLQDGQFDQCDLTLKELSAIEESLTKSLAAHYHCRIPYPDTKEKKNGNGNGKSDNSGIWNNSYSNESFGNDNDKQKEQISTDINIQ